ncbi:hypothetical protein PR048_014572 [Dryococelus australis]|uniref:Uncharacterized protein n=1 Tax=Dryococelus australis TaxID=614101 RepID=A0ABQ9HES9_9NEOP|nr:hypothetical protein PR048_014572 [Dryococelus australis]
MLVLEAGSLSGKAAAAALIDTRGSCYWLPSHAIHARMQERVLAYRMIGRKLSVVCNSCALQLPRRFVQLLLIEPAPYRAPFGHSMQKRNYVAVPLMREHPYTPIGCANLWERASRFNWLVHAAKGSLLAGRPTFGCTPGADWRTALQHLDPVLGAPKCVHTFRCPFLFGALCGAPANILLASNAMLFRGVSGLCRYCSRRVRSHDLVRGGPATALRDTRDYALARACLAAVAYPPPLPPSPVGGWWIRWQSCADSGLLEKGNPCRKWECRSPLPAREIAPTVAITGQVRASALRCGSGNCTCIWLGFLQRYNGSVSRSMCVVISSLRQRAQLRHSSRRTPHKTTTTAGPLLLRRGWRVDVASFFSLRGRACVVVRLLASHPGELGSLPGGVARGFSHVGIAPGDTAGRRVFSRFPVSPRLCIPALLDNHLARPTLVDYQSRGWTRSTILPGVEAPLCPRTTSRRLAEANLLYNSSSRVLPLTLQQRRLRLHKCQTRATWNATEWRCVVLVMSAADHRARVWRAPGECYNYNLAIEWRTASTAGSMVWGAINDS